MSRWAAVVAGAVITTTLTSVGAHAAPAPDGISEVPTRTALSFAHTPSGLRAGTPNQGEARPGLSIVKLYMADYMMRHGDGSAEDRALAERMIRSSDDGAASRAYAKYPHSIDAIAAEYGLTGTRGAAAWGSSATSTADAVTFLETKKLTDPTSPILGWMAAAEPVAADGTPQDWGTALLPSVTGTKWGWSDYGPAIVASASFGPDFSVSAHTYGSSGEHTTDVLEAFGPEPALPQEVPLGRVIEHYTGDEPLLDRLADAVPPEWTVPSQILPSPLPPL